ncbi:MAG: MATE family efflux transporter [Phyllobacteriaceae bacterium]|nr:MATE family efflux transporter [Phyllobacteriaceae bacterium]
MKHVVVMTATGSIGLISVFLVDVLNLYYISLLGKEELSAAIGFAGTVLFFTLSFAIGLTIATGALVSRALGRGDREAAAQAGGAALVLSFVMLTLVTLLVFPFIADILTLLGATGRTHELAVGYMQIVLPSSPLIAVGMGASGILRGVGDARRAMFITLFGAIVAAIVDPILIFGLDLELTGAAIATVISRIVILIVGLHGALIVHRLVRIDGFAALRPLIRPFLAIGIPAIMTQLATPIGNAYVTIEMARFGDDAVAAWAIIGRLVPVAFGAVFALSGAVGPILGQNYGARLHHRLYETMRDALIFTTIYTLAAWALLALFHNQIGAIFGATGETAALITFFCLFAAGSFLFNGALFVANAAFNNLGHAFWSTVFNWGRATLGTFPFVWAGAKWYGAEGILAGWGLGAVIFGVASIIVCFKVIAGIEARGTAQTPDEQPALPDAPSTANLPFTSGKGAL